MKLLKAEVDASAVEYKGGIYFIPAYMNALFRLDLQTRRTELLRILGISNKDNTYRNAYRYKEHAYFIPWEIETILYVNLITYEIKKIKIPYKKMNRKGLKIYPHSYYFSTVKIRDNLIFLTPTGIDTAVLIDMKTKEITLFENIVDVENEVMWGSATIGNSIFISPCVGKRMIELNYISGEYTEHPWIFSPKQYSGMCAKNRKLYFAPNKANNLLSFDIETNTYEKIMIKADLYDEKMSYLELLPMGNLLWILPWWSKYILIYNIVERKWSRIKKDDEICIDYDTEFRIIDYEEKPIFATCRTGYFSIYEKNKFRHIPVYIDCGKVRKYIRDNLHFVNEKFAPKEYKNFEQYIGLENYLTICSKFY